MCEKVQLLVSKSNTKTQTKHISTLSAHSASAHCELVLMLQHHNSVYVLQHTDRVMINTTIKYIL